MLTGGFVLSLLVQCNFEMEFPELLSQNRKYDSFIDWVATE